MENVFIMDHPLIQHKISMLRNKNTGTNEFRKLIEEIAVLMGYEALRDLPLEEVEVETPIGAAGLYCNAVAADFQREGEQREMFKALIREIVALSHAMGIEFEEDLVERNLKILASLSPEATTSMQRDVIEGKRSEMDGLVYEVVRMGREYKVSMPQYEKAAACFREQGIL